jgi:two-component system sensor histidine kinase/response regulator
LDCLDLRLKIDEDKFCTDPERVQQILFHLLGNAIKFTPECGTVILRIWREKYQAVFQVEDTGIGIAEQHLPLLFEKFQQLERSRERIYGGTGLGLALTKQLVELHQGRIEVESTPEKGSLFTVWLPNQAQHLLKSTAISPTDIPVFPTSKSIILVANDEEIATLMCELLTAANYKVVWLS